MLNFPRRWFFPLACLALIGGGACAGPVLGEGFSTVTTPIQVPLYWQQIDGGTSGKSKLGIYVTLGGGSTPQLFEFDTGAPGFVAAYGSGTVSPWWGDAWTTTGGTFSQQYDSGLAYTGTAATTTVRLFASATASTPLLTASNVIVGQALSITNTNSNPAQLWPPTTGTSPPPIEDAFYGDFGMSPAQGKAGMDSLAGQLLYGPGVTPGFRVHASDPYPWVQFGLSAADTVLSATSFALNLASGTSPAGVQYADPFVVTGSLSVTGGSPPFNEVTGLIFDTGAATTIHSGTAGSTSTVVFPASLTSAGTDTADTFVMQGLSIVVSGSSVLNGDWPAFIDLTTSPADKVRVQFHSPFGDVYYLNTGITPFTANDVVYDLAGQTLTLVPRSAVPELDPSGVGVVIAVVGGVLGLLERGRRAHVSRPAPDSGRTSPSAFVGSGP